MTWLVHMVMIMTMIVINVHEAKARLSEYLEAASRGERILICKRNQPVAELRAVEAKRTTPRPTESGAWRFDVPATFFEPLPASLVDDFENAPVYGPRPDRLPTQVADRPNPSPSSAKKRPRR